MNGKTDGEQVKHRLQFVFNPKTNECSAVSQPADMIAQAETHEEGSGPLQDCLTDLDHLVGLHEVKTFVQQIYAWLEINKRRRAAGLLTEQQVLHMVFTGNPGTGKTTVARVLSHLFREIGVLSKGHLVEVERADLVGEYIGHTAQKTRDHVKKALGGILFIDEAYSLARGGDKDFGKEAIDTMVKSMEDYKNDFILILAGYCEEMNDFIQSNPGLPSRFPVSLYFPDFKLDQLLQIAEDMVKERQYRFSVSSKEKLTKHLQFEMENQEHFGNARYVRNLIEQAVRNQAVRLLHHKYATREDLMTLRGEDFQFKNKLSKVRRYSWYNQEGILQG